MTYLPSTFCILICILGALSYTTTSTPIAEPRNVHKPLELGTVLIPSASFTPQAEVKAKYRGVTSGRSGRGGVGSVKPRVVEATFQISAVRPAVNLENFDLSSVQCSSLNNEGGSTVLVSVTFKSAVDADAAYKAWSSVDEKFIAFVGHAHNCLGMGEFSALDIHKVSPGSTDVEIEMLGAMLVANDVVKDLDIHLKHFDSPHNSSLHSSKGLDKDWDRTWTLPLNVNYNPATGQALKPSVPIVHPKADNYELDCINCFSHGDVSLEVYLHITWGLLTKYRVNMRGNWNANVDALLTLKGGDQDHVYQTLLFSEGLVPFSVPGLFKLGPVVELYGGVSFGKNSPIEIRVGLDAWCKFDWEMYAHQGIFGGATFTKSGDAGMNAHKVSINASETIEPALHVMPSMSLGMTLLKIVNIKLGMTVDHSLGVHLDAKKDNGCPTAEPTNMQLFHQHKILLDVNTKIYNKHLVLYESKVDPISCPFCHKCIRPMLNSTLIE